MKRKEPTHSEDLLHGASSSSTSPHVGDNEGGTKRPKENDYEVFLSFRGKDTRKGFTDHLYASLVDAGIHVFKDNNELHVGEEIGPELLYSITQSKISIPIISEDYASSKWCLRELAQMLKCRRSREQVILPIFYKVEPSKVQHLIGRFGDAINAHKKNLNQTVVNGWEDALKEVCLLKGWESEKIENGHEAGLVKMVIRRVMSELKRLFQLDVPKQLVGTAGCVEEIMSKIDARFNGTWFIGIYGMGGIGKTTLAKILYNNLSTCFENRSFVANIRETSKHQGITCLQKQLISDIIGDLCEVSNVDDGISVLKSRFTNKKVLALLDDIDDYTNLKALVGGGSWFEVGSIVIITTRDKSVLDKARANHMYKLNELPLDQSLILFSRHAFRKEFPPSGYEDISHDVVSITGGLPLALEVIGSFLCGKTKKAWTDTSKKLKKVPENKVLERLRISYEALDYLEQQIFLDIACFFIGESIQNPIYMWDACDFFPGKGIEVLSLMSLIKVERGKLMMHDQLRDLGREIVRQENQKKPQKRSRLWISEKVEDVLASNKGTSEIEALCLDNYGSKSYRGEMFNELTNLRFLKVRDVNFIGDFQNLLPRLRWLDWENCPSDFEMVNFHPENLVVLNLSRSEISEDWGGWGPLKMATKLKVLNLSFCKNLRRTPDLSALESLKILDFEGCTTLEEIHPSIGKLVSLNDLYLYGSGIWGLPESISELSSLQHLDVRYCKYLQEIPEPPLSLTTLLVDFPTPSLPYLSKLTLLQELSLFDLRPLECLLELPVRLSKLRIKWGFLPVAKLRDLENRLFELIRNKSSGLREVTVDAWGYREFFDYHIAEATNPTIAKSSEEGDPLFDEATSPSTPAVATSSEEGDPLSLSLSWPYKFRRPNPTIAKSSEEGDPPSLSLSLSLPRVRAELVKTLAEGNLVIDMWIIKEASGGKVQKHIGEGEWSCCWTCGTLDSQNSLGSFKLIIRREFDMLQGCKRSFWRQSTKSHRQGRAVMLLGLRPSGSPQCIGFFQANHQE